MTAKLHTFEAGKTYASKYQDTISARTEKVTIQKRTNCYVWIDGRKFRLNELGSADFFFCGKSDRCEGCKARAIMGE